MNQVALLTKTVI